MGCPCEYGEQRRKREPRAMFGSGSAWLLFALSVVLGLVVFGFCVAFLLAVPR